MDYSAAVIPVTKADKNVDTFNSDYKPLNEIDRKTGKLVGILCEPSLAASLMNGRTNCST